MANRWENVAVMFALLLTVLVAQAPSVVSPVPPPAATWAPAGWTSTTFTTALEYGHFVRHESDGNDSVLTASRQVCDCQPDTLLPMMQRAFTSLSKGAAVMQQSDATICGRPGKRLIVTNIAASTNALRNSEMLAFRDGNALVVFDYTFRSERPLPDAEATEATLCGAPGTPLPAATSGAQM